MFQPTIYRELVDRFVGLTRNLPLPTHFALDRVARGEEFDSDTLARRQGGEFDVMQYFTVLPHLTMQDGYVLDYVYRSKGVFGSPTLYTRKTGESRYGTYADYKAAGRTTAYDNFYSKVTKESGLGEPSDKSKIKDIMTVLEKWSAELRKFNRQEEMAFLRKIHIADMSQGYFEAIILGFLGTYFYRRSHYPSFHPQILCDPSEIEAILGRPKFPAEIAKAARAIDMLPHITLDENLATVAIVVFSNWGGFDQLRFRISRTFPHIVIAEDPEKLVEYDWGIRF